MLNPTPRVHRPESQTDGLTVQTLFEAEETPLLRYAFALIGRREVAEEIVQDVFLQLHVHWDEIQTPKAWLFRSVRNRVYSHIRDHRHEVLGQQVDAALDGAPTDDPPENTLQRLEAKRALRQIIDQLDEPDRQLVKLKYFEGLKYRDISGRTGLSVSNVGYRLHHALKALAEKLRPFGMDESS